MTSIFEGPPPKQGIFQPKQGSFRFQENISKHKNVKTKILDTNYCWMMSYHHKHLLSSKSLWQFPPPVRIQQSLRECGFHLDDWSIWHPEMWVGTHILNVPTGLKTYSPSLKLTDIAPENAGFKKGISKLPGGQFSGASCWFQER